MLVRHSVVYLFARGLPGLINLAALMLFTRMLSPEDYGQYAIVIAGVGLGYVVLYRWLQLGISRFYPRYESNELEFLISILFSYLLISIVMTLLALLYLPFIEGFESKVLYTVGIGVLWLFAFHELNLELVRIKSKPQDYALYALFKSLVSISIGALLIWAGWGALGLLGGVLIALIISSILGVFREWHAPEIKFFRWDIVLELLRYGLPLIATFVLSFIISSSDRFIIGWLLGVEAAGSYSAGYDIASLTLGIIMVVINLAAYPLVVRALENQGVKEAKEQLSKNFVLLFAVALPSTVGLIILTVPFVSVFLGEEFREAAVELLPWIAVATLLSGLKVYYFDLSFHLGKKTLIQIWSVATAAVVNIVLNMLWIPEYGVIGAAYATLVAYMIALLVSIVLGKRLFELPVPVLDAAKIVLAALVMGVALNLVSNKYGIYFELVVSILTGGVAYFSMIVLLNVSQARGYLKGLYSK